MDSPGEFDRGQLLADARSLFREWGNRPGMALADVAGLDVKWSTGVHQEYLRIVLGDPRLGSSPDHVPPIVAWQALDRVGVWQGRADDRRPAPDPEPPARQAVRDYALPQRRATRPRRDEVFVAGTINVRPGQHDVATGSYSFNELLQGHLHKPRPTNYVAEKQGVVAAFDQAITYHRGRGRTRIRYGGHVIGVVPRRARTAHLRVMCDFVNYRMDIVMSADGMDSGAPAGALLMFEPAAGDGHVPFTGIENLVVAIPQGSPVDFTFHAVVEPQAGRPPGSSYPRVLLDWRAQPTGIGGGADQSGVGGRFEIDLADRTLRAMDAATRTYFTIV